MRRARQRSVLREQRRARRIAGAAGAAVLLTPGVASAIPVTTNADAGAGSLRAAVAAADANAGPDTITFNAGITLIRLTSGQIPITQNADLTIQGPSRDQLTITGDANSNNTGDAGDSRIFNITAGTDAAVAISGLTLTRGFAGLSDPGGAINVDAGGGDGAELALSDVAVTQSQGENGGGIASVDDVTIADSIVSGNTAVEDGGGVGVQQGILTVDRSTISGNRAGRDGAGAFVQGPGAQLTVRDSTVSGNEGTTGNSSGGGLRAQFAGLEVQRSAITDNKADSGAGVYGLTGKYGSGIFDSTVSGNTATGVGGGVVLLPFKYDAKVSQTTVSGNQAAAGAGAAIASGASGRLTIERSTLRGNTATGPGSTGGGLLLANGGGDMRLVNSTVTGNTAATGGGVAVGYDDAPVFKYEDGKVRGSADLDNSTIAGNTGGGVFLSSYDFGTPTARRVATVGMTSTILADNTGPDADRADDATAGGIAAAFSLIEAPGDGVASSTGVITGQDPQLGGLGDNGGPTQTMVPAGTSPALDQGRSSAKLTTDQRGEPRLVDTALPNAGGGGDGTDIGAVELPAPAVVIPPPPVSPAPTFTVAAGTVPISPGTPLLPASLTPLTCAVTIVKMTGCDVAIRSTGAIKVSKQNTVPRGALLAEAQPTSSEPVATLSGKARLTADGRAVLRKRPIGVAARAVGVAATGGGSALTTNGRVHLLAGPTVTLKLKKGSKLAKSVRTQLGVLGKLLAGAKTISVTATGPSKKKAAKLAKAGGSALTDGGATATPSTKGKKAKKRRLKVSFTP